MALNPPNNWTPTIWSMSFGNIIGSNAPRLVPGHYILMGSDVRRLFTQGTVSTLDFSNKMIGFQN